MTRTDWRDLPPVDVPPRRPSRLSTTLLECFDKCRRSAYLSLTEGGGSTHEMDRGSGFHEFARVATEAALEHGEVPPHELGKAMLAQVLAEHPEWTIPKKERDRLRQMVFHWCEGVRFRPERLAAVESLFTMDVGGWTISGRIDRAEIDAEARTVRIRDYKTTPNVPTQEEFEASYQVVIYALLVAYGFPTRRVPCPDPACDGGYVPDGHDDDGSVLVWADCSTCRGRGAIDERLENIGAGLSFFDVGEEYPAPQLRDDGTLHDRYMVLTRLELGEWMADLEQTVAAFDESLASGKWQAVRGSHCSRCPAPALCPLPQHLRPRVINSREDAVAEAVRLEFLKDETRAKTKELKDWAKFDGGRIRYGRDRVLELAIEAKRSLDKDGLARAVTRSVELGEAFPGPDAFYRVSSSNTFRDRTLSPSELAEERMQERGDD